MPDMSHPAFYWQQASAAFARGDDWLGNEYVKVARALESEARERTISRILSGVWIGALLVFVLGRFQRDAALQVTTKQDGSAAMWQHDDDCNSRRGGLYRSYPAATSVRYAIKFHNDAARQKTAA